MGNNDVGERVKQYFRVKARQLATVADLPVCEHSGLIGSHREELQRIYLSEVLPRRFEVSRGMVYGRFHRSHEADIVIWDAQNYPSLPMLDHAFFFVDSVRVVMESKSSWSREQLDDVLRKCRAVRDIVPMTGLSLEDRITRLEQQVLSLQQGTRLHGMLITHHHVGTAAIFLKGGFSLVADTLTEEDIRDVDDAWPDALLLLEAGRVIVKQYIPDPEGFGGKAFLNFFDLGEDALLVFTAVLLWLVSERSVQVEDPLFLVSYVRDLEGLTPVASVPFPIIRPVPQRAPVFSGSLA